MEEIICRNPLREVKIIILYLLRNNQVTLAGSRNPLREVKIIILNRYPGESNT